MLRALVALAASACVVACAREATSVTPPAPHPLPRPGPSSTSGRPSLDAGAQEDANTSAPHTPQRTTFELDVGEPLAVTPMDLAKYETVTDRLAPAQGYVLRGSLGDFRIVDAATKKTVASARGWFAKWLSATEVTFVGDGFVSKIDVGTPTRIVRGGRACRIKGTTDERLPPCDEAPRLPLYVTRDLEHALVMSSLVAPKVLDLTPSGVVTLFDESVGVAVSNDGAACVLTRRGRVVDLRCAVPAWAPPRLVRTFEPEAPVERFAPEHLHFYSAREALVSLPRGAEGDHASYEQCIVALDDGATRCARGARHAWFPIEETGRFALEQSDPKKSPVLLVDAKTHRIHSLGVFGTRLTSPLFDPGPPAKLIVARMDKRDVHFGAVTLPAP